MVLKEFFATLGLNVDGAGFKKADALLGGVSKSLAFFAGAVAAAGAGFVALIAGEANAADKMGDLASSTGLSAESFQRLASAANKLEGTSAEEFSQGLIHLTKQMGAAKAGTEETSKAFSKLGVKVTDGRGHLRNVDETLLDLADKFSKMPDSTEKSNLALKVFGKSGAEMIPILNHGREEIEAYAASATIFTDEQLKAGEAIGIAWRSITGTGKGLLREVIGPLLPAALELLKSFKEWIKANRELIKTRIVAVVSALGYAFRALLFTLQMIFKIFGFVIDQWKFFAVVLGSVALVAIMANVAGLATLVGGYIVAGTAAITTAIASAAAWIAATLPIILLVALVAFLILLFEDLWTTAQGGDGLLDTLWTKWHKFIENWADQAHGKPAWLQAIKDAVATIMNFGDAWHDAIEDAKKYIEAFGDWLIGQTAFGVLMKQQVAASRASGPGRAYSIDHAGAGVESLRAGVSMPEVSNAGKGNTVVAPLSVQMTVETSPGMSTSDVADAVQSKLEEWHATKMEETLQSVADGG